MTKGSFGVSTPVATVEVHAGQHYGHPGMYVLVVSRTVADAGRLCGPYYGGDLRKYAGDLLVTEAEANLSREGAS